MEVMTRLQAAEKGLLRYYTGKPCRRGHHAERYTRSNMCVECSKLAADRFNRKVSAKLDKARGVAA